MSIKRHDFTPDLECSHFGNAAYVSISRFEKDWPSHFHTHNLTEIFYIISGTGKITVENTDYQIQTNDMILIKPNAKHKELSSESDPLEYLVIGIKDLTFTANPTASVSNQFCTLFNAARQQRIIKSYCEMIHDELNHQDENSPRMLKNIIDIVLILLIRVFDIRFFSEESQKQSHNCFKTKAYIDAHFKENITLDILSEATHMSKFYLTHSFSNEFGLSPIQYLTKKRLNESCSLLMNTDMSIASIAETVGYESASYFSQVFKQSFSITPRKWRKQNTEQNT